MKLGLEGWRDGAMLAGWHGWQGWPARFRRGLGAIPGLTLFGRAFLNYVRHESANQAGHVAFSAILALFPFLLFLSTAASYLGAPGLAAELAATIAYYLPPAVAEATGPVVDEVLSNRNRALLAIGIFATLWAASSGAQAIRTALNRAYGVEHKLSFWRARLKVLVFTVIGTIAAVVAFSSVVILPYLALLVEQVSGDAEVAGGLWVIARYGLAFVVLVVIYAVFYQWLPDLPQAPGTVLPGAVFGALAWLGAAALLSWALRSAGKLSLIYGGFAGIIATLVFLYISAATLIFGAEVNAVLRDRRHDTG